ncbi:hypothetical protein [Apilactobacillus timberlakei]|uniref:hypothetical protein n=1 Tax=Apilactobacillus timberlakei TaxID=2008380 RepID=UPI001125DF92|nr:hypothetical protein [Apilactobacillus timberlakei]TPR19846.1 hypothetical protein DY061_05965 [Apilactobacillus timberlakei]TPR21384.1 hypothetical protein DY083_06460 [Apilactobacillus timberlakei]
MKTNWKLFGLEMLFFVLPLLIIFILFNANNNLKTVVIKLAIWMVYSLLFMLLAKLLSKNHPKIGKFYYELQKSNNGLKNKSSRMLPIYVLSIFITAFLVMILVFLIELYIPNFSSAFVIAAIVFINSAFIHCTDFEN